MAVLDYDRKKVRTSGLVELPLHIRWSTPSVIYDPPALWDELVLPPGVRKRWAYWLSDNRRIFVRC